MSGAPTPSRYLRLLPSSVTLRAATPEDDELLYTIYASTRTEELAPVRWTEDEKRAFLWMQHGAQSRHYALHYVGAEYLIIEYTGVAAGRVYLHERPGELRIVDLAMLPPYRGRGIGRALLTELQRWADAGGHRLSIHVERQNRAQTLYRRLGFEPVGEHGIYLLLERSSAPGDPVPGGGNH